jgi:hypothetical protein
MFHGAHYFDGYTCNVCGEVRKVVFACQSTVRNMEIPIYAKKYAGLFSRHNWQI